MIKNIKRWTKKYNSYLKFNIHDYAPVWRDGVIALGAFVLGLFVIPIILSSLVFQLNGGHKFSIVVGSVIQCVSELPICLIALLFIRQFWEKLALLKFSQELINFGLFLICGMAALLIVENVFTMFGNYLYQITHSGATLPNNSTNEDSLNVLKNANLFIYLLLVIFVGPISEEIGMRLGIMNLLPKALLVDKAVFKWILFGLSSLLFGLMHVFLSNDYWHAFPYVGSGLVFASIYAFSGFKIHYSISVHLSTNVMAIILDSLHSTSTLFIIT